MKQKKITYMLFPLAGVIFCLWYLYAATADGIYSDYVRLVNSYLPDVANPKKFFVPDILTRIPITYLGRIINVTLFDYNLLFDRVLGVMGLGLSGVVLGLYCRERNVNLIWYGIITVLMFSLNKWEMLVNGSGWPHFLAFAGFYLHYLFLDRIWREEEKGKDRNWLFLLPFLITLLTAGPYCASYSATIMIACGFCIICKYRKNKKIDKQYLQYIMCTLIPLLLYMWSNSMAINDHAAPAANDSLLVQLMETPGFFVRFLLKSFSSMVIGYEQAIILFKTNGPYIVLGFFVFAAYLTALWMNFRHRIYEQTIFPLMLLVSGGINHVLILLSRWIFLNETYGASSRYALQFQVGILGIILTFAFVWKQSAEQKKIGLFLRRLLMVFFCTLFLGGNCYTTHAEIKQAPHRKQSYEDRGKLAQNFENLTDDQLRQKFEYRKTQDNSGELVRNALTILKENGLSVFRSN